MPDGRESSRGEQALANRLKDESKAIRALERQLAAATRRRRLLALKLARAGWSERRIAAVAKVSGPAVHYMLVQMRQERWEANRGA